MVIPTPGEFLSGHAPLQMQGHPGVLDPLPEVPQGLGELLLAGDLPSQPELAADLCVRFEEVHLVAQ